MSKSNDKCLSFIVTSVEFHVMTSVKSHVKGVKSNAMYDDKCQQLRGKLKGQEGNLKNGRRQL